MIFFSHIEKNRPSFESILSYYSKNGKKCSPELAKEFVENLTLQKKSNNFNLTETASWDELLNAYDVSKFNLRGLSFLSQTYKTDDYMLIGRYDEGAISIRKKDKKLVLLDINEPDFQIMEVSNNLSSFLASIIDVFEFHIGKYNGSFSEIEEEREKQAIKASNIAGGEQYFEFYAFLLGV